MARQAVQLLAFNRGVISKNALARVDLKRMQYSAEDQTNWIPRAFGPMMLRPGWGYLGINSRSNLPARRMPFIRATTDAQILEATDSTLRPIVDEAPIVRVAVATTITNGTFAGNITGWTSADQTGATSAYDAPNQLGLSGTGTNDAITYQAVSVAPGDQAKEHGIRIVINRGPVMLRIGTALGTDDLQQETSLGVGTHSLGITPGVGTFYIYFFNRKSRKVDVGSVAIEGAGELLLPATWTVNDLPLLRWDQSADVLYVCDGSHQQSKIERRAARSWSVVLYQPEDGPFLPINFTPTALTPSALTGDITISATSPVFNAKHVGALFRLSSAGQEIVQSVSAAGQYTSPIRVTGVGSARTFTYTISGTWSGELELQVSSSPDGGYSHVRDVHNGTDSATDGRDNEILYYRIGFKTYTSGTADIDLVYSGGSIDGIVRITAVSDNENVSATVLSPLGGSTPTNTWNEGAWSDFRGWPKVPLIHEDRLWWFGLGKEWGSVVDAYDSYDDSVVGDSGPITRTIGKGPVDWINWALSLERMLAGTDGQIASARSDSLDTPLTPSNFNLKFPVTQGCARIAAVSADDVGYFVHRNLVRLIELAFDTSNYVKLDYGAEDLTALCPEVCKPGIVQIAVQRQPDTRIHCVLADGSVVIFVRDKLEDVIAAIPIKSPGAGGKVEDIVILPQDGYEDAVHYLVNRTINSTTVRLYEKWADEADCVGGTLNLQADSYVTYSGAAANVLTAIAPHLVGQQVIVWADGADLSPGPNPAQPLTEPRTYVAQKTYLVAGDGTVTLDAGVTVSNAVLGLGYQAFFKGVKLAYAAQDGSALAQRKDVSALGLIANDMHSDGIRYGSDYDHLTPLPLVDFGAEVDYDKVWDQYDGLAHKFDDMFGSDSRVCIVATAPRPARVLALIVEMSTTEDT